MTLVVIIGIALTLFVLGFVSKRRFGTLGLALAAGALLASHVTTWLGTYITQFNIETGPLSAKSAAAIVLTLLPALVLLFSGPAYTRTAHAIFGATAFALMGTLLIIGPLTTSLSSDASSREVLIFVARYNDILLVVGILVATVDAWLTHTINSFGKRRTKKHD